MKNFVESESGPQYAKLLLPIEFDYLNRNACLASIPHNTSLSNEILIQLSASSILHHTDDHLHDETISDDSVKKHFNLIKTTSNKSLVSKLDDLKAKANQYAKSRTTKSLLHSYASAGGGDNLSDLNIMNTSGTNTVPYLGRFMPSKKIESMTSKYKLFKFNFSKK